MVFVNELGKLVTLTLSNIKDNVTGAEVKTLMQTILTNNIFDSNGGNFVSAKAAALVATDTQEISIA
jgi:hypothetical protein